MNEQRPARLDRAALERIIQRAAELQTADREPGEGITPDQLLLLGKEVGIPPRFLQQALAEERSRLPEQMRIGLLDRLAGPGVVVTHRVIGGPVPVLEGHLLRWMEQNELLCVQRQQPGRITWEPLTGLQAALRRSAAALGAGQRTFMLGKAGTVTAALAPLEPDYCHVALAADVKPLRGAYVTSAAALATAGAGGTALLVALSAMLALAVVPLPIGLGLGYGALRRFRPVPARTLLGLERCLDHLERLSATGPAQVPRPAGLLGTLADEVRRTLR
ncbi:MAG: hypothetical protein ACREOF_16630 [Gemmatimonadales bacterium]